MMATKSKQRQSYEAIGDRRTNFGSSSDGAEPPVERSLRSIREHKLNVLFGISLGTITLVMGAIFVAEYRQRVTAPAHQKKLVGQAVHAHATAAKARATLCLGVDWLTACDAVSDAGGRRRRRELSETTTTTAPNHHPQPQHHHGHSSKYHNRHHSSDDDDTFVDDLSVTFDNNCLKVYRLDLSDGITFPYHSSQFVHEGGEQTMVLFVQHGAMRDSEHYFCSFKKLMLEQKYRPFSDILIIAPDFNYERDELVFPNDAFWNSTKPWGDWRVGAESDPNCCGNTGRTVSSFDVLDHFLALLTNKKLFPNIDKISFVGHSAGALCL